MKRLLITFFLIGFFIISSFSQDIFLLQKTKGLKNYKYYPGDHIHLRIKRDILDRKINGVLTGILDSSIILNGSEEIYLRDITFVFRNRQMVRLTKNLCYIVGAGYFFIDALNRTINCEYPIVTQGTLKTGGLIAGTGLMIWPFQNNRIRVGKKWRLKCLVP
jgi:hypothetical protein